MIPVRLDSECEANNKWESLGRTCRNSRFILSRIFVLIPPEVILARQRSLKTICISAPWVIISSIAAIWFATLYDARRSRDRLSQWSVPHWGQERRTGTLLNFEGSVKFHRLCEGNQHLGEACV